jgi:hypothetical protein
VPKSYHLDITEKRVVALDAHFQCQNPACRFASPMRIWGEGEAKRTHSSYPGWTEGAKPITEIPAAMKTEAKIEAEAQAWGIARQRYSIVRCPRCTPGSLPWVQFLALR